MSRDFEIDRIQAIAVSMFASALIERCQEMIVRLTSAVSFPAEVADFRDEAIRHLKNVVPSGLTSAEETEAIKLACENIEEVCASWLKGQGGSRGASALN